MAKKTRVFNMQKTSLVEQFLTYRSDAVLPMNIYFKCCLVKGMVPRYKNFCVLVDCRYYVINQNLRIASLDPDLDLVHLDNVMRSLYENWKKCPFLKVEMKVIQDRGITNGVRAFLENKS